MGAPNSYKNTGIGSVVAPGIGTIIGYQMDEGAQARTDAQDAADAEAQRVADAQQKRDALLGRLREVYGVGTSSSAQGNARTIQDAIRQFYQAQLGTNLRNAEDQFAGSSRVSRQNLARVGQLGSGLDASARSSTLADFLKARQTAITQAQSSRDALTNKLTSQRLGLETGISTGQVANPDFSAYAASRDQALSEAQRNIVPQAVGNLFNAAGQTYFQGRVQEAQGNQGMSAFGFSNGSNRGSIT